MVIKTQIGCLTHLCCSFTSSAIYFKVVLSHNLASTLARTVINSPGIKFQE